MRLDTIGLALAAVLAAALPAAAQGPALKIGYLSELSGPLASSGEQERNGFLFYLQKHGNALGGRSVEIVSEDTAGDPATAIAKVKKLVESDAIDLLIGPISSATGAAIKTYVVEHAMPTLLLSTVDDVVDGKYMFRTSFAANAEAFLEGYLPGVAGHKKAVLVAPNYNAGQSSVEYFGKGFAAAGGTAVQTLLPRLGTADFGSFIAQFSPEADCAIVFMPGADAVRFIKQYADYGSKLPLYGFTVTVDETLLPAEGKAALGFIGASSYFSTIDTAANKAYLKDWAAAYPTLGKPTWISLGGYIAASVLDAAIAKVGGKVADREPLLQAIKATRTTTPAGGFRFDDKNNPVMPRYIMQIRETAGEIGPVVLGEIPEFEPVPAPPKLPAGLVVPR